MDREELKSKIQWKERSANISRSWGDKAGYRKALREAERLREKLNEIGDKTNG